VYINRFIATALCVAAAAAVPVRVSLAQDYFIPGQQRGASPPAARQAPQRQAPVRTPPPVQVSPLQEQQQQPQQGAEAEPPLPPIPLPPAPDVPTLPKGTAPPVAVVGVMGVPEVMRASTAAQQVEKVIGERRERLNQDAQKEQSTWREMQQALGNDRAKLSPEQIRGRERELQDRITTAQRKFRERNQIIQQSAQVGLGQIERTLIAVIREVAESRGMNLVLHRAQVALNINEFDITDEVTAQLNKILPTVLIPPEDGGPIAQAQPAPGGTTAASVPAGTTPPASTAAVATSPAAPPAPPPPPPAARPAVPARR
jgi:Skp family chaperone for outer membrane proteins